MTPTYVSLFAGVGGFDLGMDAAGYRCVAQVEWDKHCQSVLSRHWPDIPRWGDIQTVSGYDLPPADVITFGSPCQDLSVAGKRAGLEGGRSSMFHEAVRIIREMQDGSNGTFPRAAIWENVPGALSSNKGEDFGVVLDEMAKLGAVVLEWAVLDARWFGVPQRRRRIFLVAVFDPAAAERCPNPLLPVAPRSGWNPPARRTTGETDARNPEVGSAGYVKAKRAMSNTDDDRWEQTETAPTLNAFDNASETRSTVLMPVPQAVIFTAQRVGEPPRVYEDGTPALLGRMGTGGNNTPMVAESTGFTTRRLTPLECERLMGWPDDHTRWKADGTEQADTHRYKQCGNGVASPVAAWVGRQLLPLLT